MMRNDHMKFSRWRERFSLRTKKLNMNEVIINVTINPIHVVAAAKEKHVWINMYAEDCQVKDGMTLTVKDNENIHPLWR
jgi:hypothetical protein